MKLKITKLIVAAAVLSMAFAVTSCKKNDVKTIEVDNSFAFSIFNDDSITMIKFLNIVDSTWKNKIHVNDDGTMSIIFNSDTIREVLTGREILSNIEPASFEYFDNIDIPEIVVPDTIIKIQWLLENDPQSLGEEFKYIFNYDTTVNVGHIATVPVEFDNFSIADALMKTGKLNLDLDLGITSGIHAIAYIQCDEIMLGDENMNIEINVPGNSTIDLQGFNLSPKNDSVSFNAWFRLYMDELAIDKYTPSDQLESIIQDIQSIGGYKDIDLDGDISDVNFGYVNGSVDVPDEDFSGKIDSLMLNLDAIQGDLSLKTPKVFLKYANTFGLDMDITIDSMFFYNGSGDYVDLLKTRPIELSLTTTEEEEMVSVDISSNVIDDLDILQGINDFNYVGTASLSNEEGSYMTDESFVNVTAEFDLPLKVKINQLNFADTLDFSIGDSINITNYLDEIEFKFSVKNGLPLQIALQLYTCDSTLLQTGEYITDSLFKKQGANVIGSSFGGNVVNSALYATVTGTSMNNVLKANKLILKLSASTGGNAVDIKATDKIGIAIGLKTKSTNVNL